MRSVVSKTWMTSPSFDLGQGVEKDLFPLFLGAVDLVDEVLFRKDALVQRPRVLGHAQGGERPQQLGQVNREYFRMRDRHRGLFRVDI